MPTPAPGSGPDVRSRTESGDDTDGARSRPTRPRRLRWPVVAIMALVVATLVGACAGPAAGPDATPSGTTSGTTSFDSATRDDPEFTARFRHEFSDVDGVGLHYVTGGEGPPLVLLHGWPQTWFEWRGIMPALAEHHTVYAVDLPGLGDSRGAPPSFDKATLARYVHGLIAGRLGVRDARLVGHDLGAAVAFQYAAQFPADVRKLAYLDLPLPGPAIDATTYRSLSWHIAFHSQPRIPEAVVGDHVREYLSLFYPQVAFGGTAFGGTSHTSPFDDREIDEYTRTYSRPEVLHDGFELYRSLDRDVAAKDVATPITTPTLVLAAQGQSAAIRATLAPRATTIVRTADVPRAGHWLAEENPGFVTTELLGFLAG